MHIKTFLAAWAFYRVLTFLYRQADYCFTVFAFAVAAYLAVLPPVAQICKIVFYLLPYSEKLSILLAALVYIL